MLQKARVRPPLSAIPFHSTSHFNLLKSRQNLFDLIWLNIQLKQKVVITPSNFLPLWKNFAPPIWPTTAAHLVSQVLSAFI